MSERFRDLPSALRIALAGALATTAGCSLVESRRDIPIETILPRSATSTETSTPTLSPTSEPTDIPITATPTLSPTPSPFPVANDLYDFEGISFLAGEDPLTLQITLPDSQTFDISADPVTFEQDGCDKTSGGSFRPSLGTSCEYSYLTHGSDNDIAHFVHTGSDRSNQPLEAEALRRYLEDYIIANPNPSGRLSPEERQVRMSTFEGALATLSRGETSVEGLRVLDVVRIPPSQVPEFMRTVEGTIQFAATLDPTIGRFVGNGEQEIFMIICGWATLGETAPEGANLMFYDWSRYVIVIGHGESDGSVTPSLAVVPGEALGQKEAIILVNKSFLSKS